jgi:hypothetical protein
MVKYYYKDEAFVIEDYLHAKTFASFLPAVAGLDGKPLWAFYANVGQAMGGFGVNSKDTPITPFDSANLAYQNIPVKSFRTFIKIDGKYIEAFTRRNKASQIMYINKSNVSISEETDEYKIVVTYSSTPRKNYTALIRKVSLTSKLSGKHTYEVVDGLPVIFPNGLSNFCYKELVSLMAAYCEVNNFEAKAPFIKFKTSTGDNSIVSEAHTGNGYLYIDENDKLMNDIVDLQKVFGNDKSILFPENFLDLSFEDFSKIEDQLENKLPSAFTFFKKDFKENETYTFYGLFGMFDDFNLFTNCIKETTSSSLDKMIVDSEELVRSLLNPASCSTGDKMFDMYVKQSFLDNNLRGGFPTLLDNKKDGEVYYVYSRKHGDMERDYNSFQIPSKYYSSGAGNFRDVNQNRRSDLYFYPYVKDYNIKIFFSLIQGDGQNPLNVKPLKFKFEGEKDEILALIEEPVKNKVKKLLNNGFEPSEIFTLIKDNASLVKGDVNDVFSLILSSSTQTIEANFAEGYWVDHWTYNVDLLENYESVYPDKLKELLFDDSYKYFYSLVYVEPRSEKYCLVEENKVRQYGAINLARVKEECDKLGQDITKTSWLKDKKGNEVTTTLASKIFNLILVKFSTLDSLQLGVEMECEKPGWNDAMNGLPGLFASGMSESIELLRLTNFALRTFSKFDTCSIDVLKEQYELYKVVKENVKKLLEGKISQFDYWDKVTSGREELRKNIHYGCDGKTSSISLKDIVTLLEEFKLVLTNGIKKAREVGNGIIPSYIIYELSDYEVTTYVNHLGYKTVKPKAFKLVTIPPFLEASARCFKLGQDIVSIEDYQNIKASGIYDKELHIYKTCADIDDAPFEIGRVHAFTKGWLERECNFLHMTYKYMLGLLKAGFYKEYYDEIKDNFVYNMDPYVYGRNPIENSSFVVPTCNPDKKLHGQGFFARLTGANAEFLNMYTLMFIGEHLFEVKDNKLTLTLSPKLSKDLFDENKKASFRLFDKTTITYVNEDDVNTYDPITLSYILDGKKLDVIEGEDALKIRRGEVKDLTVIIRKD